jgi:hypothetical protein
VNPNQQQPQTEPVSEPPESSDYAALPEPIRLDSTRPSVTAQPPADPTMGRNLDQDEALLFPG